jgi:hypothetical protein
MGDTIKLQILKITCNSPSESGHDEVYLICQADAGIPIRYPAEPPGYNSMTTGNVWTLDDPDLVLHFQNEVLVTLWDSDVSFVPSLATYLLSNDYQAGSTRTTDTDPQTVTLVNPDGASYTIETQVVA